MRRVIACLTGCAMLAGCVYPAPGYVQGYGYPVQQGVVVGPDGETTGTPVVVQPGYAPGYYPAPAYYPDYAGAAVGGLALGAIAGVAIGSACCYGGGYRHGGWGGYGGRGYGGYGHGGGGWGGHGRR